MGRRALFAKKLRLCSHIFDLSEAAQAELDALLPPARAAAERLRETKRQTLLELVNFYSLARPVWSNDELAALFDMLQRNLFRPLPPSSFEQFSWAGSVPGGAGGGAGGHTFSPEEDPHCEDPAWPHLQCCYELLLRVVAFMPSASAVAASAAAADAPDEDNPYPEPAATLAQLQASHKLLYGTYLSRRFLMCLLQNFGSEDSRERDYVKTVLHRIYAQAMPLRPYMRRCIQHILWRLIYEDERAHGVAEMLEVLGSIINGFAVPLKRSHVDVLLRRVLLPLHKLASLGLFHPQLSYAVVQFMDKDPSLANPVLLALLKYWPRTNSKKELLFLNEVEEVLERVPQLTPRQPTRRPATSNGVTPTGTPSRSATSASVGSLPGALPDDPVHLSVLVALVQQLCCCAHSVQFQVSEKAIALLSDTQGFLRKFIFFDEEYETSSTGGRAGAGDFRATLLPILARAVYLNTEAPLVNMLGPVPAALRSPPRAAGAAPSPPKLKAPIRPLSAADGKGKPGLRDPEAGETAPVLSPPRASASAPPSAAGGTKGHWNPSISELTGGLADVLRGEDPALFVRCQKQLKAEWAANGSSSTAVPKRAAAASQANSSSVRVNLADAFAAVSLQEKQRGLAE